METAKKGADNLFLELAKSTEKLSEIEKKTIITMVKIDRLPPYHKMDMQGNGLYVLEGKTLDWTSYALAKIKEVEKNKSQPPYS